MAKKQPAIAPGGDKQVEIERLEAEAVQHDAKARELLEEKRGVEYQRVELDEAQDEKIKALLQSLPKAETSELVAKLAELSTPERTALDQRARVLAVAAEAEAAEATRCRQEVKRLTAELEAEAADQKAREVHAAVLEFVERFKAANGLRLRLFEQARQAPFSDWPERFKRLGLRFPLSIGVLLQSHLSKRNPDSMSVADVAETLENIGGAYNERPLQIPGAKQSDAPMTRSWYFNPSFTNDQGRK